MKKLTVAILGQGRSGRAIHAHCLTTIPALQERYRIALVCDPRADRLEPTQKDTGCAVSTDWRTVLGRKDLDLVINVTPSDQHVAITKELLEAGHHVLCDKPLARRVSDVDMLISTAKRCGRTLAIFQQSRFAPYFTKVREIIDSGILGRIVQIKIAFNGFGRRWDWQTLQKMNAGNLLNTGPHPVDQALQLFGDVDPQVFCRMDSVNYAGDADSHVKLILWGPGRPTIDVEISNVSPYTNYTYQVCGANGALSGTMDKIEWKWFLPAEAPLPALIADPMPNLAYCSETLPWKNASWEPAEAEKNLFNVIGEGFYLALHRSLAEGQPLAVTPAQVRRQIAVIEECHRQNPLPVKF
jgi:scyllo-inositol 2-dehydrogenase (NADP+)